MEVMFTCGPGLLRRADERLKELGVERARHHGLLDPCEPRAIQLSEIQLPRLAEQRDHHIPPPGFRSQRDRGKQAPAVACWVADLGRAFIAVTATGTAPRRRARVAVSSSSAATSSCSPDRSAARCHACRSGWSVSSFARASWARRRSTRSEPWASAERISGCRKRIVCRSASTMPAAAAGATASRSRATPAIVLVALRTSPRPSWSFRAATRGQCESLQEVRKRGRQTRARGAQSTQGRRASTARRPSRRRMGARRGRADFLPLPAAREPGWRRGARGQMRRGALRQWRRPSSRVRVPANLLPPMLIRSHRGRRPAGGSGRIRCVARRTRARRRLGGRASGRLRRSRGAVQKLRPPKGGRGRPSRCGSDRAQLLA